MFMEKCTSLKSMHRLPKMHQNKYFHFPHAISCTPVCSTKGLECMGNIKYSYSLLRFLQMRNISPMQEHIGLQSVIIETKRLIFKVST